MKCLPKEGVVPSNENLIFTELKTGDKISFTQVLIVNMLIGKDCYSVEVFRENSHLYFADGAKSITYRGSITGFIDILLYFFGIKLLTLQGEDGRRLDVDGVSFYQPSQHNFEVVSVDR